MATNDQKKAEAAPAAPPVEAAAPVPRAAVADQLVGRMMTRESGSGAVGILTPPPVAAAHVSPDEIVRRSAADPMVRRVEVRNFNAEARTVDVAFASEVPVRRWFGDEVLSLEPGAMRAARLEGGLSVVMDHDWSDVVGVVEAHSIGADRVARATLRLGRSPRASEVLQDVADGIRRHISVGYHIHRVRIEERENDADLVTILDWEPLEISFVGVPADASVGVGRSAGAAADGVSKPPEAGAAPGADDGLELPEARAQVQRSEAVMERVLRRENGDLVRAKVNDAGEILEVLEVIERAGADVRSARESGSASERERVATILEMGRQYAEPDLAREYAAEGRSPADMQAELLRRMHAARDGGQVTERSNSTGMSEREAGQFSFLRALRYLSRPEDRAAREAAAFEIEASEACAAASGRSPQGILVPPEVLTHRALNTSVTGAASGDTGGHLIATSLLSQSFMDLLRNRTVLMRLATPLTGLDGLVDIPKLTEGASGYWIGEDEDAPATSVAFGHISAAPKTAAALHEITRRMLMQSSLDVEALVRRDLALALGNTIDLAGFYGTGTASQPLGLANTTGVNVVEFASANPTFAEIVDMETEIAADNADVDQMAYVFNARMRGHFKTTERFVGTGLTIWEQGGTVNGYNAEVTNQIANGEAFHGNFADAVLAMWGGLDLTIDPYTHSAKGRLRIVAMQDVDWVVRRPESFAYGKPAAPAGG